MECLQRCRIARLVGGLPRMDAREGVPVELLSNCGPGGRETLLVVGRIRSIAALLGRAVVGVVLAR